MTSTPLPRHRSKQFQTVCALALGLAIGFSAPSFADNLPEVQRLIKQGQYPQALEKVDAYLSSRPKDAQGRFLKGLIYTEMNRPADAIGVFTKLTEDYPELPEPYNNLAVLYAQQKQYDKARTALEMAIRTHPSYAIAYENLGDIYAKLASQAYSKALQLDANTANSVKPKLAMIRSLFSADAGRGARPGAATPAAPTAAPAQPAKPSTTVAAAPAPTPAPTPAPAPQASAAPAAPVPAATASPAPAAAPTPAPAPASTKVADDDTAEREVKAAVEAWAAAWSAKDMKAYLGAYGKDFSPPGRQSRSAWEKERESRIVGKSRISVKLSNLQVSVQGDKATVRFQQAYSADALNVSSRKTLDLVQQQGRWTIVRESTGG